ncbi:MAG: hypothetical protein FJZ56_03030 [Chlamydiae bacterium]|nr:hypothetical protein [Chlamydiota bacterium]
MTSVNAELPTMALISNQEIDAIILKHKLYGKYHLVIFDSLNLKPEDLLNTKIDVIVINDTFFHESIFSFCASIKKKIDLQFIPILVISNNLKKTYHDDLKKAGALDLLQEPIEELELFSKLEKAMQFKEAHKKIDELRRYKQSSNSEYTMKDKTVFSKSDALKIQKMILGKHDMTLILVEQDATIYDFLVKKMDPDGIVLTLTRNLYIVILPNKDRTRGQKFAHLIHDQFPKSYQGVVFQEKEHEIFFPSLEEMIRVARQCLIEAKSKNSGMVCYI